MTLIFKALGHKKPQIRYVDFGVHFSIADSSNIEAAYSLKDSCIYVNTSSIPTSKADREAAISHENVHYQVGKVTNNMPDLKLALNGKLINTIGLSISRQIGQYIDHNYSCNNMPQLDDQSLANEIIPYLASISTPGSSHRKNFTHLSGTSLSDLSAIDNAWYDLVQAAELLTF